MENSLGELINTALTKAANAAIDASVEEIFTTAIEKAVKERAKKMERTFIAAVNAAVRRQTKKLEAAHRKATEVRIAKAVKKAVLEAKIGEVCFEPCVCQRKRDTNAQGLSWSTPSNLSVICTTKQRRRRAVTPKVIFSV